MPPAPQGSPAQDLHLQTPDNQTREMPKETPRKRPGKDFLGWTGKAGSDSLGPVIRNRNETGLSGRERFGGQRLEWVAIPGILGVKMMSIWCHLGICLTFEWTPKLVWLRESYKEFKINS